MSVLDTMSINKYVRNEINKDETDGTCSTLRINEKVKKGKVVPVLN